MDPTPDLKSKERRCLGALKRGPGLVFYASMSLTRLNFPTQSSFFLTLKASVRVQDAWAGWWLNPSHFREWATNSTGHAPDRLLSSWNKHEKGVVVVVVVSKRCAEHLQEGVLIRLGIADTQNHTFAGIQGYPDNHPVDNEMSARGLQIDDRSLVNVAKHWPHSDRYQVTDSGSVHGETLTLLLKFPPMARCSKNNEADLKLVAHADPRTAAEKLVL